MRTAGAALLLLSLLASAPPARAGEDELEGSVQVGWRFLRDEDEGRFVQDRNLEEGIRLFALSVDWEDPEREVFLSEGELALSGVGDPSSDYLLRLRGRDLLTLDGGYRRDDYTYRSTGDPFPYETIREHSHARGRFRASSDLALRFGWRRSTRRGTARTSTLTEARQAQPGGVDDTIRDRRPLERLYDTYDLGIDWGSGPLRLGFTETLRVGVIEDERAYSVPGDATPVRQELRRDVRTKAWTTLAKAGTSLFGGDLTATLFYTYTRQPLDARLAGDLEGFDNGFFEGSPKGAFSSELHGQNRHQRSASAYRLETAARPDPDLELTLGVESERTVDDVSLRLIENRRFENSAVPAERRVTREEARIRHRTDRASLDAFWDLADDVRVRLGEEYYVERLDVPGESRGGTLEGSEFRSRTWRHTAGLDARPARGLSLSLLGRYSRNTEPHSTVSAETAEEVSFRGRYRVSDEAHAAVVYRRKAYHHSTGRDSDTRSDSVSGSLTAGADTVGGSLSVTWQEFETRTSTSFFDFDRSTTGPVEDRVTFRSRDLIVNLDAHYDVTAAARLGLGVLLTFTRGDYEADAHELSLTGEVDLSDEVSVGAALRSWRLDEGGRGIDDYTVYALEILLGYRF